eukprot:m.70941 g.70941  ORF g.70941 m.70941 type:complete len:335 (-) comp7614_c0_seq2:85-1089(-)
MATEASNPIAACLYAALDLLSTKHACPSPHENENNITEVSTFFHGVCSSAHARAAAYPLLTDKDPCAVIAHVEDLAQLDIALPRSYMCSEAGSLLATIAASAHKSPLVVLLQSSASVLLLFSPCSRLFLLFEPSVFAQAPQGAPSTRAHVFLGRDAGWCALQHLRASWGKSPTPGVTPHPAGNSLSSESCTPLTFSSYTIAMHRVPPRSTCTSPELCVRAGLPELPELPSCTDSRPLAPADEAMSDADIAAACIEAEMDDTFSLDPPLTLARRRVCPAPAALRLPATSPGTRAPSPPTPASALMLSIASETAGSPSPPHTPDYGSAPLVCVRAE